MISLQKAWFSKIYLITILAIAVWFLANNWWSKRELFLEQLRSAINFDELMHNEVIRWETLDGITTGYIFTNLLRDNVYALNLTNKIVGGKISTYCKFGQLAILSKQTNEYDRIIAEIFIDKWCDSIVKKELTSIRPERRL